MSTPIVSVDELCVALEQVLKDHLQATMQALGFGGYGPVKTWQQLPAASALSTGQLPAIATTSAGLVGEPAPKRSSGVFAVTWRLANGIYVRGTNHDETQARVRNWCAGIRATALAHKSLGGLASSFVWVGEEYANLPDRSNARTLAAGAVAFNVTAEVLINPNLTIGPLPVVSTTPTSLSVQ